MTSISSPPRVVVCHPGRQHSHQLALALAEQRMLIKYITGVPTNLNTIPVWARHILRPFSNAYGIGLDPHFVTHIFVAPIVRRVAYLFRTPAAEVDWGHRGEAWFDRLAARHVAKLKPDIVVCYENAALETFRTAKRFGARLVLDAASVHHSWQDRFYAPTESRRVHQRIVRRKDAEIELADLVLAVSELAGQTYIEAGVPANKIVQVSVGVDLSIFKPAEIRRVKNRSRPIRFVFVGGMNRLKGIDVLYEACRILANRSPQFELTMIGKDRQSSQLVDIAQITTLPRLSHSELAKELPKHDVLVLPSRFDSFGMVVAEAMACGLPAIVTQNVGAKEMIIPNANGQIVLAEDATALAGAMAWFIDHVDHLPNMAAAAISTAENYSWSAYQRNVVARLSAAFSLQSPQVITMNS